MFAIAPLHSTGLGCWPATGAWRCRRTQVARDHDDCYLPSVLTFAAPAEMPPDPQDFASKSLFWNILPINPWGSRSCRDFSWTVLCFQDLRAGGEPFQVSSF